MNEIHLSEKLKKLKDEIHNTEDLVIHHYAAINGEAPNQALVYIQGMVDYELANQYIKDSSQSNPQQDMAGTTVVTDLKEALFQALNGNVLHLMDRVEQIKVYPLSQYKVRSISESSNENVIRGPREAFIEDLSTNLTMVRRKIKSKDLTVEYMSFGRVTQTKCAILYLQGVCTKSLIKEVKERLSRIDIDGVLGTSYLESYLEDNPFSPFPQLGNTERPDVAASALLDGRVVIMLDGTPVILMAPVTMIMLLQSAEDYYQRHFATAWIRSIRLFFVFISLMLPSIYVAVTTFHTEMLPTNLLITIAAARDIVPFPALVEALILEISIEALREAGLRVPKPIGQAISIFGALVIGTAAVQAGIVSASMVIIVSITAIASFVIPHYDLGLSFRLLRFPLLFAASIFGLYGVVAASIPVLMHLCSLRSFGTPYLSPFAPVHFSDWKDALLRFPYWSFVRRPHLFGTQNHKRNRPVRRPKLPQGGD